MKFDFITERLVVGNDFTLVTILVGAAGAAFYLASTGSYVRAGCFIPALLVVLHLLKREST